MSRLKTLASAAAVILMLKAPAFAQPPVQTSSDTASAQTASDAQDQSLVDPDQSPTNPDQSQASSDTPWWSLDNDWWGEPFEDSNVYQVGWLPTGPCGFGSNQGWAGALSPQLGNADRTSLWFPPAGSTFQYPLGSGWCRSNYGYGNRWNYILWVNRLPIRTNGHHSTWNRVKSNTETQAAARDGHGELQPMADAPDDDWTRVDDVRFEPGAATRREFGQAGGMLKSQRPMPDLRRPPGQRGPRRVRAAKMQGMEHRRVARRGISGFHGTVHLTAHVGAHPAAHVAARSGGRGHT